MNAESLFLSCNWWQDQPQAISWVGYLVGCMSFFFSSFQNSCLFAHDRAWRKRCRCLCNFEPRPLFPRKLSGLCLEEGSFPNAWFCPEMPWGFQKANLCAYLAPQIISAWFGVWELLFNIFIRILQYNKSIKWKNGVGGRENRNLDFCLRTSEVEYLLQKGKCGT